MADTIESDRLIRRLMDWQKECKDIPMGEWPYGESRDKLYMAYQAEIDYVRSLQAQGYKYSKYIVPRQFLDKQDSPHNPK